MKRVTRISGLVCLLALSTRSAFGAAPADSSNCFSELESRLRSRQQISILQADGMSLKARFLRLDPASQNLVVEAYLPAADRFGHREIPRAALSRVEWKESRGIPATAVMGAILLGGFGIYLGNEIANDPDAGTGRTRDDAPYLLGTVGASLGFLLGYFAASGGESRTHRIDCALPADRARGE